MVFDSSAVLAILLSEPGADFAAGHLTSATISAVNVQEVLTRLIDGGMVLQHASAIFQTLKLNIAPHDMAEAIAAADLRASTRSCGLSLGDRTCLALGKRLGKAVVTADRHWQRLDLAEPQLIFIR